MSAPRVKVVVVGSINMDVVVRCATLPVAGQTILADSSAEFCGGKGANQAVAAARAGADVSMIGRVGSDAFADRLINNLRRFAVDTQCVQRCDDIASGMAVIAVENSGQNSIMVVPGANARVDRADVEAARHKIEAGDVLLLQLEIPVDAVLLAMDIAKQAGVRVVLDPAPVPTDWPSELLQVDLLCPNESEAAELTGQPVHTKDQAAAAARKLCELGAKSVAITMGDQGSMLLHNEELTDVAALDVDAVDTTAAGDAFAGALAVHWSHTNSLPQAVAYAGAAGALAASRQGAQSSMATAEEIEARWRTPQ